MKPHPRQGLIVNVTLDHGNEVRTVSHGKVDVEHSDEVGMRLKDIPDVLSSEGLFPEPGLDLVQDLLVSRLGFVENYMSAKDPSDT